MITRISIKEQVYEYLKKGVVEGKLQPGMVYSEQMIADTLHVSRTPVREAIQLLRHENLVEVYSNRGFGVKDICAADIEEIIQARLALASGYWRANTLVLRHKTQDGSYRKQ